MADNEKTTVYLDLYMSWPLPFDARNAMARAAASSSKLMQNYTLKPVKISIKGAGSMQKKRRSIYGLAFDRSAVSGHIFSRFEKLDEFIVFIHFGLIIEALGLCSQVIDLNWHVYGEYITSIKLHHIIVLRERN